MVALAGGSIAGLLARHSFWARLQRWLSSMILIGLGICLGFSERR
jgi:threonine/homoserine/homoserine lactone efflux protein